MLFQKNTLSEEAKNELNNTKEIEKKWTEKIQLIERINIHIVSKLFQQ